MGVNFSFYGIRLPPQIWTGCVWGSDFFDFQHKGRRDKNAYHVYDGQTDGHYATNEELSWNVARVEWHVWWISCERFTLQMRHFDVIVY